MNKRVYNQTFGKIVRTLGFLLILASSVFFATTLILENQSLPLIGNLVPFAQIADGVLGSVALIADYAGLALIIGFILLLWAIRRGLILRILLTVILLFVFIEGSISNTSPLVPIVLSAPSWISSVLTPLTPLVNQVGSMSPYVVPGISVAAPFLLWMVFAYKKPSRFSLLMLRAGTITLFLAILLYAVAQLFVASLQTVDIYNTIRIGLYIVTYLLFIVGGLFGTIGFTRK